MNMSIKNRARRRAIGIVPFVAAVSLSVIGISGGEAGAATGDGPISDVITFTSHVTVIGGSQFVLVSDSCTITSTGEAPVPCSIVGAGTLTPSGGVARAVVTSSDGVIVLNETYVLTVPTTSVGTGPAIEIEPGAGVTTGTFVGNFVALPTNDPNVLLDSGTITVRDAS